MNRYSDDVLAQGWQRANKPAATPTDVAKDLVLEELLEETTEEEEVSVVKNEVPRTGGEADAVTAEETWQTRKMIRIWRNSV